MVKRKGGRKFKHFAKDRIEVARDVVILVINDGFVSKFDLDVGVRFSIWILRLKINSLHECMCVCVIVLD